MIKITHWHNATVMIEQADARILCDPWLVGRAYMGAWTQWPQMPDDIIERVGPCDYIWISHCHPDHYHPETLRAYFDHWGEKVLLCSHESLRDKMTRDGFLTQPTSHFKGAYAELNPNKVDSALVWGRVVNMNDNPYDQVQIDTIRRLCRQPAIALVPFAGAGPYPQSYAMDPATRILKAQEKKEKFLARFAQMRDALGAKLTLPFAGQYALCGRLAAMNATRGQADATEAGIALWPGGAIYYDEDADQVTGIHGQRQEPYPEPSAEVLEALKLDYEDPPLGALFARALRNAGDPPCLFQFQTEEHRWQTYTAAPKALHGPHISITMPEALFIRLLKGDYHWSDAEIGSHYQCERMPDLYDPAYYRWLWDLHA